LLRGLLIEVMVTLHQERREKEQLQHRMKLLLQRLYGPRSERCNQFSALTDRPYLNSYYSICENLRNLRRA
jgi:hypothetical protein